MGLNFFMQLLSIAGNVIVVLFVADMLFEMKYSFHFITVRYLFHNDREPMDWLVDNIEYLGLVMFFIGHFMAIVGLLHQFGLNQLDTKPKEFFVSSPMSTFGIAIVLYKQLQQKASQRFFK